MQGGGAMCGSGGVQPDGSPEPGWWGVQSAWLSCVQGPWQVLSDSCSSLVGGGE